MRRRGRRLGAARGGRHADRAIRGRREEAGLPIGLRLGLLPGRKRRAGGRRRGGLLAPLLARRIARLVVAGCRMLRPTRRIRRLVLGTALARVLGPGLRGGRRRACLEALLVTRLGGLGAALARDLRLGADLGTRLDLARDLARRLVGEIRRLVGELDVLRQRARQEIAEAPGAGPAGSDRLLMAEGAHGAVGQRFERHGLAGGAYAADHLGDDRLLHSFEVGSRRLAQRAARLHLLVDAAFEQQGDEVGLADLAVADRGIGLGRVVVGEHDRATGVGAQAMQDGREVGVSRQQDELVEARLVVQHVAHVHHHADVGGVLELRRQRRAIDDLEARAQEVMAHERKRVHVGRVVARVAAGHGIAVAAAHDDAARQREARAVGRRDQPAALDLAQPQPGVLGEPLGRFLVLSLQR